MPRTAKAIEKATKKEPTAAVIVDGKPDKRLVDDAVEWIRAKLAETLYKGMREVGEYVFTKFFDGDVERVASHDPNKDASFRMLVDRCGTLEVPLSKSGLHRAVQVAVMVRRLEGNDTAFKQLPPSHQEALLRLKEPERVEKAAQRALAKKMSVRGLRDLVKEERSSIPADGRGRKRKPSVLKSLDQSNRIFAAETGKRGFTKAQLDELDEDQRKEALASAKRLAEGLAKLIERLEAVT